MLLLQARPPPRPTLFPYTTLFRSPMSAKPSSVAAAAHFPTRPATGNGLQRSEEHTSELQSHSDLVCRLLLEKKKHPLTHTQHGPRAAAERTEGGGIMFLEASAHRS